MKRFLPLLLAATFLAGFPAAAQNVPDIQFDSAANALTTPDDIYLGEVGGVATDSKGNVFVYTRTGHPTITLGRARLRAWRSRCSSSISRPYTARSARPLRLHVRLSSSASTNDNIWSVDQMTNIIISSTQGRASAARAARRRHAIPTPAAPAVPPAWRDASVFRTGRRRVSPSDESPLTLKAHLRCRRTG